MIDKDTIQQVKEIFESLDSNYTFLATIDYRHEKSEEFVDFMKDFTSCSERFSFEIKNSDKMELGFVLLKDSKKAGIKFRGIPSGHEFTSLILAVLNADGKGKNLPDDTLSNRIKSLKGPISLKTYVSLSCTNCPDIVQSLNIMALLNDGIEHEMIDGETFQEECEKMKIQAVPTVYANGEQLHVGRSGLGELLDKLENKFGHTIQENNSPIERFFDLIVLGGGPAGVSAAIYSARKGLKVAIIAERIGGQVKETVGIENLISIPYTTGTDLANALKNHLDAYNIKTFENRNIKSAELKCSKKRIYTSGGELFISPAVIIATGASWRKLKVEGEADYIGRGVAFCPHCDGPFYENKDVAVIGGGNSGIEAAIDLATICRNVTIFEFAEELKADKLLTDKAKGLANIKIFTSSQTTKVIGNGEKVMAIRVKNRQSGKEEDFPIDGIFVQIGLAANSTLFEKELETTNIGEIVTDDYCRTTIPGVYAAGDVSNVPYKQIIIAMGEGAKAALSAFDDRIRGKLSIN